MSRRRGPYILELGQLPDLPLAKCNDPQVDPEMFHNPAHVDEAIAFCQGCPEKFACRQAGRETRSTGVWGARAFGLESKSTRRRAA